jgi:predicted nuclease with TOPRIM domain
MKSKEAVPLRRVLKSLLGEVKSVKYLHGLDFAYIDATDIYQGALANLLNGNTEKTLKCVIFGLDLDRDNTSIIHLARTMLFSLSEDFYESNGDIYRQKYHDLEKATEQIKQKIKKTKNEMDPLKKEVQELENALESSKKQFLLFFFRKGRLNRSLQTAKLRVSNINNEITNLEEDFENISFLVKIEEYMKVLGLVLEVCIFPVRFNWALPD